MKKLRIIFYLWVGMISATSFGDKSTAAQVEHRDSLVQAEFQNLPADVQALLPLFKQRGKVYALLRGPEDEVGYKLASMAYLIPSEKESRAVLEKINQIFFEVGEAKYQPTKTRMISKAMLSTAAFTALSWIVDSVAASTGRDRDLKVLYDPTIFERWARAADYSFLFFSDREYEAFKFVSLNPEWQEVSAKVADIVLNANAVITEDQARRNKEARSERAMSMAPPPGAEVFFERQVWLQALRKLAPQSAGGWPIVAKWMERADLLSNHFHHSMTALPEQIIQWLNTTVRGVSLDLTSQTDRFDSLITVLHDPNYSETTKRAYLKRILHWLKIMAVKVNRSLLANSRFTELSIDVEHLHLGSPMNRLFGLLRELERKRFDKQNPFLNHVFSISDLSDPDRQMDVELESAFDLYPEVGSYVAMEADKLGISKNDLSNFSVGPAFYSLDVNERQAAVTRFSFVTYLLTKSTSTRLAIEEEFSSLSRGTGYPKDRRSFDMFIYALALKTIRLKHPGYKASELRTVADLTEALGPYSKIIFLSDHDVARFSDPKTGGLRLLLTDPNRPRRDETRNLEYHHDVLQRMINTSPIADVRRFGRIQIAFLHSDSARKEMLPEDYRRDLLMMARFYGFALNKYLDETNSTIQERVDIAGLTTLAGINQLFLIDQRLRANSADKGDACDIVLVQ